MRKHCSEFIPATRGVVPDPPPSRGEGGGTGSSPLNLLIARSSQDLPSDFKSNRCLMSQARPRIHKNTLGLVGSELLWCHDIVMMTSAKEEYSSTGLSRLDKS